MSSANESRPLVTFGIYAYNEEKFIREAVKSAFAQTYSPLEIVLSDDCSSDRTFEIMQEMAALYSGPHKVILNSNPTNLGIGDQLNAIVQLSQGELIIMGAGDDISFANRTERNVQAWLGSGRKVHSLFSDAELIDERGCKRPGKLYEPVEFQSLEGSINGRFGGVYGATQAITRDVFTRFGPFHPRLKLEDNALLLRATLIGGFTHIPENLVQYRVHEGNTCRLSANAVSFEEWKKQVIWANRETALLYLQFLNDLFSGPAASWDAEDLARARRAAIGKLLEYSATCDFYSEPKAGMLSQYWGMLFRMAKVLTKLTIKSRSPFIDRRNARRTIEQRRRISY